MLKYLNRAQSLEPKFNSSNFIFYFFSIDKMLNFNDKMLAASRYKYMIALYYP